LAKKYDNGFGSDYFRCQCSDISGLNITSLPSYYQKAIKCWHCFLKLFRVNTQMDALRQNYFWKCSPPFQQETLFFKSFSKSGLNKFRIYGNMKVKQHNYIL
jgi:hypothetical protein